MIANRGNLKRNEPVAQGGPLFQAPENSAVYQREHLDIFALVIDNPHILLESGHLLFAEGDPPSCMYIVKTGALQIRSGSVVYEDVGPGGIVGEMCLVGKHQTRSATVYALTDSELVEVDDTRFFSLIAQAPSFAITVMQGLSRRLRAMDRRYLPSRGLDRQAARRL
jgi:CRP/FNR family transcriptional regulator, cyclic AMP receptor protein